MGKWRKEQGLKLGSLYLYSSIFYPRKELHGIDKVTPQVLSKYIDLLSSPLIQPGCEKLFELMKNVLCALFESEKEVDWKDVEFVKLFFKIKFISKCEELQRIGCLI